MLLRETRSAMVADKMLTQNAGIGVIEKNIEVKIARRFKRQGRSWTRRGAEHLLQLCWLQNEARNWNHWWQKPPLAKTKVNPGWSSSPRPPLPYQAKGSNLRLTMTRMVA